MCAAAACRAQPREYPVRGQLIAVSAPALEVTLNHEDIPGFMPAMTMAYHVKDAALLTGLTAGDLVTATLVVPNNEIPFLKDLRRTGHADLPADTTKPRVMDVMQPGDTVPSDVLEDQDGARRRLSDWNHRALAVTFIYTRCPMPDFCPLMDRRFAALQKSIAGDPALRDSAHLVSITFDPTYDTPAVLKKHAANLSADPAIWSFLTAAPDVISRVASRFGVSVIADPNTPTFTHNLRTAVIDPRGRLVNVYSGNDWTPDGLLNDLRNASRR
jgi:protein SCO1/2